MAQQQDVLESFTSTYLKGMLQSSFIRIGHDANFIENLPHKMNCKPSIRP
jgi:hypothetical protein